MRRIILILLLLCACSVDEFQTKYAVQLDELGVDHWRTYYVEEVPANASFGYEKTFATATTHMFDAYVYEPGLEMDCVFAKFVGSSAQQPRSFDCKAQVDNVEAGTHYSYSMSSFSRYKYLKTEADVLDLSDKYPFGDCTVYFIDYQGYYDGEKDFVARWLCGNTTIQPTKVVP